MYVKDVIFKGEIFEVHIQKYFNNDRKAIICQKKVDPEYDYVATINIPEENIDQNMVIIKNYSENEGILDMLIKEKIVTKPIRYTQTGTELSPVCILLVSNELN